MTVEAQNSKHKKKDTLPLHAKLVEMLKVWLKAMGPSDKLFPKLARRRTWLMVKKDLERVGILYENEDGIADFHAAGRHTHITELLRNGATLPEAQKLARHSDIKVTMKYAHIGLDDQARAVANLPAPHGRCISGVAGRQSVSTNGSETGNEKSPTLPKQGVGLFVSPVVTGWQHDGGSTPVELFAQGITKWNQEIVCLLLSLD